MTTLGEKIRKRRQELNLSPDELALKIGKNRSTIYRYENGDISKLPSAIINPLSVALKVSPSFLLDTEENDSQDKILEKIMVVPIKKIKIPILGNIACGKPTFAYEELECYTDNILNIKADFALWAKGDSMIDARINDGDLVFIKKQDIVENGEIAAVLIEDEATLKKVFYDQTKQRIMLVAANEKYQPFIYEGEELDKIRILGKAVAFQSCL